MRVFFTVEQTEAVAGLWALATAMHPPANVLVELRRADFTESGRLYIDLHAVPAATTAKMREAFTRESARQPAPAAPTP